MATSLCSLSHQESGARRAVQYRSSRQQRLPRRGVRLVAHSVANEITSHRPNAVACSSVVHFAERMLADLASQGCAEPGSETLNNPLARLGKAVMDFGRQSELAGGGGNSSASDSMLPPGVRVGGAAGGPSGMLPQMGPAEREFMQAFDAGHALQHSWDEVAFLEERQQHLMHAEAAQAAAMAHGMIGHAQQQAFNAQEEAWHAAGAHHDVLSPAQDPSAPQHNVLHRVSPMQQHAHPAFAGAPPHMGLHMGVGPPPHMLHARLPPAPHLGVHGPPMASPFQQAWSDVGSGNQCTSSGAPGQTASPLSASEVRLLDEAHERAWRELAGEQGGATALAQEREADNSQLPSLANQPLSNGGRQELEEVWQKLSVAGGVGSEQTAEQLNSIWNAVRGSDFDAWEQDWQLAGSDLDAHASEDASAAYRFHENNPYLGGADLLAKGTELFRAGRLHEAVLALEAAVQAQPDDTIAWQMLGQAHADADDDARAIPCLRRAVAADPHNLDALLALGVSYTNELDQTRALRHLQLWLESHPDFVDIAPRDTAAVSPAGANPFELQKIVTEMFLRAATERPDNADLHAVLGVLYNLSRSYPEAIASFEHALRLRPTDYSLWNKLGATKANSMSCAEAVPCYIKALELKPEYVRALSNLGISYGNMSNYEAAAQCYLKALSLNQEAVHLWGYLSMTFTSMDRPDLLSKASRAEYEVFRQDFDF